ncbi:MAG: TetR/AcrR family transcriptional regulator [Phycisphaerales bacterium]
MPPIGRPREFDRAEALQRALEVFWTRGYEATQVEELVEAMGIGRGSMYAAFGDKRGLFLEALEAFVGQISAWYREKVLSGPGTALENLRGVVRRWPEVAASGGRGCFLTNSLIERAGHDPEVAAIADRTIRAEEMLYRGVLSEAQERGELGRNRDIGMIARALVNARLGITLQAKLQGSAERVRAVADVALEMLE